MSDRSYLDESGDTVAKGDKIKVGTDDLKRYIIAAIDLGMLLLGEANKLAPKES